MLVVTEMLMLLLARPVWAIVQEALPTGSIGGRVVDEQGAPIAGARCSSSAADGLESPAGVPGTKFS
jgi:hypothetical protein